VKQAGVETAAPGASDTSSGCGVEGRVFAVERGLCERQVEGSLYPRAQMLRWEQVRFFVLPVFAPAQLECGGLMLLRQTGDQIGVAGGDPFLYERLGHCGNQVQERQAGVDVGSALAGFLDKGGDIVARQVQEVLEALRLLVRVNVHTLGVFDQLPFHRRRIAQFDDAGRQGKDFGKLRRTEAAGTCDDLEAFFVRANGDGLDKAVLPDALSKLVQLRLLEGLAGVGGGFMDGVDGKELAGFVSGQHLLPRGGGPACTPIEDVTQPELRERPLIFRNLCIPHQEAVSAELVMKLRLWSHVGYISADQGTRSPLHVA
jgi:hypothetical protein